MGKSKSRVEPPDLTIPAVVGVILLGLWIYFPALHGVWIADDDMLIRSNPLLREPGGFWKIWFAPGQVDYFPLTMTVFRLIAAVSGGKVVLYHFTNIALHIGSGLLLWRLLKLLGVRHGWMGALLWVAHPLAVESVAWMSELKNTLSQFLVLLSLIAYVRWPQPDPRVRPWYWASWLLFVLAMLAKSSVVMLPFVLLLYAWWKHGRIRRQDVIASVPFFAAALVLGCVTVWFQQERGIGEEYIAVGGLAARVARAGLAVFFYLYQSLFPANVMFMYPRWEADPPSFAQFLPWPALAALLAWFWMKRATWGRHVLLGFGFFLLNLVPVLGFVTMAYFWITWTADHFAYLSLAGIVGLVAAGVSCLWVNAEKFRPALGAVFALVVGLLAWESHSYAAAFRDPLAAYSRAAQSNPEAWHAHRELALIYTQLKEPAKAHEHYAAAMQVQQNAIQKNPADPVAHYQLGLLLREQGRLDDALAQFEEALRLKPDYVGAHGNAGFILYLDKRVPEARQHFLDALRLGPDSAEIRYDLGTVYMSEGNFADAAPQLEQAVKLKPDYAEAHFNLGQTYEELHRPADALREFEAASRLRPDNEKLRQLVETLKRQPNP